MMFVYWAQSLIIGFFTALRILSLRIADFPEPVRRSRANPGSRYRPDQLFRFGMIGVAGIFSLVYAFFHYGYFTFLADLGLLRSVGTSGNANSSSPSRSLVPAMPSRIFITGAVSRWTNGSCMTCLSGHSSGSSPCT
jgi:hypothetical protein